MHIGPVNSRHNANNTTQRKFNPVEVIRPRVNRIVELNRMLCSGTPSVIYRKTIPDETKRYCNVKKATAGIVLFDKT
jgi:hypothetical protein